MSKTKPILLGVLASVPVLALLLGLAFAHHHSRFTRRVNAVFDPQQKAFRGIYLPWPIGRPTLAGGLEQETYWRIRSQLGYGDGGTIRSNGMTLTLHASDGTFLVHAD